MKRVNENLLEVEDIDQYDTGNEIDQLFTLNELRMLKYECERSHLQFARVFFREVDGGKFIVNDHHSVICDALERVLTGEIKRLIINVPPGYTKTELAVNLFIARGLALNPRAKFIHTSYSDNLASTNSSKVRDVILNDLYQRLWPMDLRLDTRGKKTWYNTQGGGMYSAAAGGQLTGFRAGRIEDGFTGAFIIDDPIKPEDALSDPERNRINNRFNSTFRSRLINDETPIILIMQRVHEDDASGFLLKGGMGDDWHHLNLPVETKPRAQRPEYPRDYKNGIPIDYDLPPGPLWEYKHTLEQINTMRKASPYDTSSQYDQAPAMLGGGIFKDKWWGYYDKLIQMRLIVLYLDTAQKKNEHNDFTAMGAFGWGIDRNLYVLDVKNEKFTAPELLVAAKDFANKHKRHHGTNRIGANLMKIEDKSSGTGLIQTLQADQDFKMAVVGIPRDIDKFRRAMGTVPQICQGKVLLPSGPTPLTDAAWVYDFKEQFRRFTPAMNTHDDMIDITMDAIEDILMKGGVGLYDNL